MSQQSQLKLLFRIRLMIGSFVLLLVLSGVTAFPLVTAGPIRGIPWFHILIDCSFGIIGIIPLWITRKWIKKLEVL